MILSGILAGTLLWADLTNLYVWAVLSVTLGFGAIGFYDDYLKVTRRQSDGFSGRVRLLIEFAIAAVAVAALHGARLAAAVERACRCRSSRTC